MGNDTWGFHVQARLPSIHDLPAEEVIHHKVCSSNFQPGNDMQGSLMRWVVILKKLYQNQMLSGWKWTIRNT